MFFLVPMLCVGTRVKRVVIKSPPLKKGDLGGFLKRHRLVKSPPAPLFQRGENGYESPFSTGAFILVSRDVIR